MYLSNIQPIDDGQALTSPTDDAISNVNYPNSFQQSASGGSGTTTVWDSEHYATFTAEVGFDDSAVGGAGQTFTVIFRNQSSQQLLAIHVSVGAPVRVNIPLRGATRLEIVCIGSNMPITFGNAQFVP